MTDRDTRIHAPTGGLLDRMLNHAAVLETEQVRPRIRRIRLGGPGLAGLGWQAGQQVRVRVDATGLLSALGRGKARDLLRTYSVVEFNRQRQWLDLCVYQHGAERTPGLDWSSAVAVGDPVAFLGPQGRLTVQADAAFHLFAGEETAQMAFAPILAALPAGAGVAGVLEIATPDERLDLTHGDRLTWTYRGSAAASASADLVAAVRALDLPDGLGVAYLAGEAQTVAAIRRHLISDRGWPRRAVLTKPFWAPGRRGLD